MEDGSNSAGILLDGVSMIFIEGASSVEDFSSLEDGSSLLDETGPRLSSLVEGSTEGSELGSSVEEEEGSKLVVGSIEVEDCVEEGSEEGSEGEEETDVEVDIPPQEDKAIRPSKDKVNRGTDFFINKRIILDRMRKWVR